MEIQYEMWIKWILNEEYKIKVKQDAEIKNKTQMK